MFAPLVARAKTNTAARQTSSLAPQRPIMTPQDFGGSHQEAKSATTTNAAPSRASWDLSRISIYPPSERVSDDRNQRRNLDTSTIKPSRSPITAWSGAAGQRLDTRTRGFFETRLRRDLGHVRIHTGASAVESASALNAKAYTIGHDIVFGQNEYAPESEPGKLLLAHELAHVAQQQGMAASSHSTVEIGNGSDRAEKEADAFALAAVATPPGLRKGNSSPDISGLVTPSSSRQVLRRTPKDDPCKDSKLKTWAGCFDTDWYAPLANGSGVDIKLRFRPNAKVDADKIAFVQTVQALMDGEPISIYFKDQPVKDQPLNDPDIGPRIKGIRDYKPLTDPVAEAQKRAKIKATVLSRTIDPVDLSGAGGTMIDQFPGSRSPSIAETDTKDAVMRDYPELGLESPADVKMEFETTALALEGAQKGAYYGSVHWGYTKGRNDKAATPLPLTLVSQTIPSAVFQTASGLWSGSTTSQDGHSIALPVASEMFAASSKAVLMETPGTGKSYNLDVNTRMELTDKTDNTHKDWRNVIVVSGRWAGKVGWVKQEMLSATEVRRKN
jgi:hypothetical protein